MKTNLVYIIFSCLITSMVWYKTSPTKAEKIVIHDTIYVDMPIDADALCESFIYVESKGKSDAVNKVSKASGVLQLMPSMVREANILSGSEVYTLSDIFNPEKSREIFHLVMQHKNPSYDIHLACKIWNPRGGLEYHKKVEEKYYELINK